MRGFVPRSNIFCFSAKQRSETPRNILSPSKHWPRRPVLTAKQWPLALNDKDCPRRLTLNAKEILQWVALKVKKCSQCPSWNVPESGGRPKGELSALLPKRTDLISFLLFFIKKNSRGPAAYANCTRRPRRRQPRFCFVLSEQNILQNFFNQKAIFFDKFLFEKVSHKPKVFEEKFNFFRNVF